jgi:hypothetical protein
MPPALERCRSWFSGLWLLRSKPEDRRRSQRDPFRASLAVTGSSGCVYRAIARDHSASGLGAIVCGDLLLGETVIVKVGERKIRGAVRNRIGSRYGFEFIE